MRKRFLSVLCVLALCLSLLPMTALAADSGWIYNSTEKTLTKKDNSVTLNNVTADEDHHLTIGRNYNLGCQNLDLSGEIKGAGADSGTTYTITAIGDGAFSSCFSLASVKLPESLTTIENSAFSQCTDLTSVDLADCTALTSIGYNAFFLCNELNSIDLSGCTALTTIGENAFFGCSSLASVRLPDDLTTIGENAFFDCISLTTIELPKDLTTIGRDAFSRCSKLTAITVEAENDKFSAEDGVLFNADKTQLICYPTGKAGTSYVVPNTVTAIGDSAFRSCTTLTSVTLPDGLSTIGGMAFSGCGALTTVDLTGCTALTSIGRDAFSDCGALTTVNLTSCIALATIKEDTFCRCEKLTTVDLTDCISLTAIGEDAFFCCSSLVSVELPKSLTTIGETAFYECGVLTSITLPGTLTSIGRSAFFGTGLTTVALPASLETMGSNPFAACTSLTAITVEAGNDKFSAEDGVLFNADKTQLICYPGGKTDETYVVPDTVTAIGDSACRYCTALTSVTLPGGVTTIGERALYDCTSLKTLTLLAELPPELGSEALWCSSQYEHIIDVNVQVPPKSVEAYKKAKGWRNYYAECGDDCFTAIPNGTLTLTFPAFVTMTAGSLTPMPLTLQNSSAVPLVGLTAELTGGQDNFILSQPDRSLMDGESTTFTLTPRANLTAGIYTAEVQVTGSNLTAPVTTTFTLSVVSASQDSGDPTYSVSLPGKVTGGTVTAKKSYAEEDETFRFTVTPDEGYELASLAVTDSRGRELDLEYEGSGEYSFKMPDRQVEIEVSFRAVVVEPEPLPFTDVADNAWYAEAVRYVYEHGLMAGTSATAFSPDATTSRSMIAAILWRMAGSPVVNYAMDYTDVAQGQWYSEAIRWAASEGIVGGYGNGLFGTNDPITREQFAAMLYRFAQEQGYDVSIGENTNILSYTDVADLSEYAISAMQWAVGAGIINGTGDGSTLSPQGQATRAQAAVILTCYCENVAKQ